MKPEDVPETILDVAWRAELARRSPEASAALVEEYCDFDAHPSLRAHREELRPALGAALATARKAWFAELFGTPEEIAAREAEAAQRTPDDTVRLCEMARPGEHERQVRKQVADEARFAASQVGRHSDFDWDVRTLLWFADRLGGGR